MSRVKASALTRFWAATLGVRSRWAPGADDAGVRNARAALAYSQMLDILDDAWPETRPADAARIRVELNAAIRECGG